MHERIASLNADYFWVVSNLEAIWRIQTILIIMRTKGDEVVEVAANR